MSEAIKRILDAVTDKVLSYRGALHFTAPHAKCSDGGER